MPRKSAKKVVPKKSPLRLGLCCQFIEEPIKFGTATATITLRLPREQQLAKLSALCLRNTQSLAAAIAYCANNGIGAFRVQSQLWPLKTHPTVGYRLEELPGLSEITAALIACRALATTHVVRLSFHPDQFVVLSSPREEVVQSSLQELEYQAEAAEWIGADVLNIHAGGGYGDKPAALARFAQNLDRLSDRARTRLTVENDDKLYAPAELLPLCRATGVPLCYDVHHHRCYGDGMSVEEGTAAARETWSREPLFHISSPREGWGNSRPQFHHDYIDIQDFPACWRQLAITIDVEAKAKELAVKRLREELAL